MGVISSPRSLSHSVSLSSFESRWRRFWWSPILPFSFSLIQIFVFVAGKLRFHFNNRISLGLKQIPKTACSLLLLGEQDSIVLEVTMIKFLSHALLYWIPSNLNLRFSYLEAADNIETNLSSNFTQQYQRTSSTKSFQWNRQHDCSVRKRYCL